MPFIYNLICAMFTAAHFVSSSSISSVTTSNILSDFVIPLTNINWTLSSQDLIFANLTARVPGDLLSDLMMNGLIDDPYIDRNFLTQQKVWTGEAWKEPGNNFSGVDDDNNDDDNSKKKGKHYQRKRTWVYSTMFDIPEHNSNEMSWKLIFEGIKMGAEIYINSRKVGQVVDQFLRYDFEIGKDILGRGVLDDRNIRRHNLTVSFNPSIRVNGRFSGE